MCSFAQEVPMSLNALGLQITTDFNNSQVIDKSSSRTLKTIKSLHTALINPADNSSRRLRDQYFQMYCLIFVFVVVV